MKKEIDFAEVSQICANHKIEIKDIKPITGNGKKLFFINNKLLLRVSETTMAPEQEKFRRVAALHSVPKIKHVGVLKHDAGPVHYTILTLIPGDDFVNVNLETTLAQQKQLGKDIAVFFG